jgi:hypothetical protein
MGFLRKMLSWLRGSSDEMGGGASEDADSAPQITREDVLRIIRREFSAENPDAILAILDQYGTESWQAERDRVHLAVVKLSGGDVAQLRDQVGIACRDYRDVIALAEYPEFLAIGLVGVDRMAEEEVRRLQQRDLEQYHQWLKRE